LPNVAAPIGRKAFEMTPVKAPKGCPSAECPHRRWIANGLQSRDEDKTEKDTARKTKDTARKTQQV